MATEDKYKILVCVSVDGYTKWSEDTSTNLEDAIYKAYRKVFENTKIPNIDNTNCIVLGGESSTMFELYWESNVDYPKHTKCEDGILVEGFCISCGTDIIFDD